MNDEWRILRGWEGNRSLLNQVNAGICLEGMRKRMKTSG
jgi:hypothetical protein